MLIQSSSRGQSSARQQGSPKKSSPQKYIPVPAHDRKSSLNKNSPQKLPPKKCTSKTVNHLEIRSSKENSPENLSPRKHISQVKITGKYFLPFLMELKLRYSCFATF